MECAGRARAGARACRPARPRPRRWRRRRRRRRARARVRVRVVLLLTEQHQREHDRRGARGGEREPGQGQARPARLPRAPALLSEAIEHGLLDRGRERVAARRSARSGRAARAARPAPSPPARSRGSRRRGRASPPSRPGRASTVASAAVRRARAHVRTSISSRIRRSVQQRVRGAALDGAQSLLLGDLAQAEPAVGPAGSPRGARREPRQRGGHLPAQYRLLQLLVDRPGALGLGLRRQGARRPAARVDDAVAGDRVQPRAHAGAFGS